jgi:hypothetical protein
MSSTEFTFWLQGYFEISDNNNLSPQQVQIIRDHLALVFEKVTPKQNKNPNFDELFQNITKPTTPSKEETRHC